MGLPAPKVAKGPCVAYQRWPARLQNHARVVNPDRKEDASVLLAVPCSGGFERRSAPVRPAGAVEVNQLSLGYKTVTLFFHLLYTAVPGPMNGPGHKQSEMWRFSASLYRTGGLFCGGAMRPEKGTPEG